MPCTVATSNPDAELKLGWTGEVVILHKNVLVKVQCWRVRDLSISCYHWISRNRALCVTYPNLTVYRTYSLVVGLHGRDFFFARHDPESTFLITVIISRMIHELCVFLMLIVDICHAFFPDAASWPAYAISRGHTEQIVKPRRLLIDHDGGVDDFIALMMLMASVHGGHAELAGVIVTEVEYIHKAN